MPRAYIQRTPRAQKGPPIGDGKPETLDFNQWKVDKSDIPLCRMCGVPLLGVAERKIGVHISCVHESQAKAVNIPRPRYG